MTKQAGRTFTEEFKTQIVNLYNGGKKKTEILREYDLQPNLRTLDENKIQPVHSKSRTIERRK